MRVFLIFRIFKQLLDHALEREITAIISLKNILKNKKKTQIYSPESATSAVQPPVEVGQVRSSCCWWWCVLRRMVLMEVSTDAAAANAAPGRCSRFRRRRCSIRRLRGLCSCTRQLGLQKKA